MNYTNCCIIELSDLYLISQHDVTACGDTIQYAVFKEKKSVLCAEATGKGERFKVRWADKKNMKGRIPPNALRSCPTL